MANENLSTPIEVQAAYIVPEILPSNFGAVYTRIVLSGAEDMSKVAGRANDAGSEAYQAQLRNDEQDIILDDHELRLNSAEETLEQHTAQLVNHETRITAAEEKIVEHEIRIKAAEERLGDHETRLTTVESDITYLTEQVVILDYRTTRKKSELTFSGISLSIPTTPVNLITLLKTLTPSSGSFAPFFDITNDKLTVFNEDKTLAFKLSIIGSWTGGTTNRSMQLTFSGATPDTIVVSRNAATSTDNVLMATFFSVDKDGFLATNGSTMTIQSNGSVFTATTIKLIAEQ
ncbi:hypothetical protein RI835_003900 [Providencia rettgeri]|nr:hypothetical protein [Providencia rettgeri]